MRISIFGLGYVGAVSCGCLAKAGHTVVGVDVSEHKVNLFKEGRAPIVETGLDELIAEAVRSSALSATLDSRKAVMDSELSIVCVGTPSMANGNIDMGYIYETVEQIAAAIKDKPSFHVVVIRSTTAPGTARAATEIIERVSGKKAGQDFGVACNPEFLREGTAVYDFSHPPYTIIGSSDARSGDLVAALYKDIDAPVYRIKSEEAELIKYANNSFHAMKVVFANEIGNICKALGVDGHAVMSIVAADTKLNLSPYYLKPGFAYGGSCLPKDVRAITYRAASLDVETPLLSSLNKSNELQIKRALEMVLKSGKQKIGFLGFAFKADTDDLRESPVVELIEILIGKGFSLSIYDSSVLLSNLTGKNKSFILSTVPHIAQLMAESANQVVEDSDVVVIGNNAKEFASVVQSMPADKVVIDLVRVDKDRVSDGNYVGICW